MAQLDRLLFPQDFSATEELEQDALLNATVPEPSWSETGKSIFWNAAEAQPTYNLLGAIGSAGEPKLTQAQLDGMYPTTDKNFWKGGATAWQAETIVDKYEKNTATEEMKNFLVGNEADDTLNLKSMGMWTMGMGLQMGAGITDPLTLSIFGRANQLLAPVSRAVGKTAATVGSGVKDSVVKNIPLQWDKVVKAPLPSLAIKYTERVAQSRFGKIYGKELAENVFGDVIGMTPVRKLILDDFERRDTGLSDTFQSAIIGATGIAGIKYFGGAAGTWVNKTAKQAGENLLKSVDKKFVKTKDKAGMHIASPGHADEAFNTASGESLKTEAKGPSASTNETITEILSNKAFSGKSKTVFKKIGNFLGLFHTESGKNDYVGARFGDSFVFIDSSEAAQGQFDLLAKNGHAYEVRSHDGNLNTLDLESALLGQHLDIATIIQDDYNLGGDFLGTFNDNTPLIEVFRAINESAQIHGMSGADTVEMFDAINAKLAEGGYQGTTHIESQGVTKHQVLSVFKEHMKPDNVKPIHAGKSENPIVEESPISPDPLDSKEINLGKGEKIPVEENNDYEYDPFYSDNSNVVSSLNEFNSKEFDDIPHLNEDIGSQTKILDDKFEETIADLKSSSAFEDSVVAEESKKAVLNDKYIPPEDQSFYAMIEASRKRVLVEIESLQKDYKANDPKEDGTLIKTIADCIKMRE